MKKWAYYEELKEALEDQRPDGQCPARKAIASRALG